MNSTEAHAARGLQKLTTGDYDEAERSLRRAIELDEDYIPAYVWLSVVMGEYGRVSEQGLVLQDAIARDPLNELLTINYAGNLHARGDIQEATHVLEGLLRLQPDSPTMLRQMWSLARGAGDLVDAWRYAARASELNPSGAGNTIAMAHAWADLGELGEADRVLLEGIEQAPGNVDIKQGAKFPYRALLPKEVEGLLVAGRCSSATMLGHYGGKSMGNMISIGQAAGVAAALCSKHNTQPKKLPHRLIQEQLRKMEVSL